MLNSRGWGKGVPVVAVHGWGQFGGCFGSFSRQLKGYRVIAPDLPGHGRSAEVSAPSLETWRDALIAWVQAQPFSECHFLGWSLGGLLLTAAWKELKDRGLSLTLIGTTPRYTATDESFPGQPPGQVRALARQVRRDREQALLGFQQQMGEGGGLVRPVPSEETLLAGLDILQSADERVALAHIQEPLLLVQGDQDRVTPPSCLKAMVGVNPGAKSLLLPGAGHAPFLTQGPVLAEHLDRFWNDAGTG